MIMHMLLQTLFKEKLALFFIISWIILQSFFYKINYQSQMINLMPISHYQVAHVENIWGNLQYWSVSNLILLLFNGYFCLRIKK